MMKVTLDTNCFNIINNKRLDPIFELADNGKICIFYVDALIFEVLQGNQKIKNLPEGKRENARKRLEKAKKYNLIKSWQTFLPHYNTFPMRFIAPELKKKIEDIIFPDREKGGKYDEGDVRQLFAHAIEKNDIFITGNTKDFIDNGKRDELKNIGITVMTPEEFLNR